MADSDSYVGTITLWAGRRAPENWMYCEGKLLQIHDYAELYAVIGTQFGGGGVIDFALPDFRGRACIGAGANYTPGGFFGFETVELTKIHNPVHHHPCACDTVEVATEMSPENHYFAIDGKDMGSRQRKNYSPAAKNIMGPNMISLEGKGHPHNNMQSFQVLDFIICVKGAYPPPGQDNQEDNQGQEA
ncbi:tail fiber protein [bacterium]|nr:tail fiber protein [bacterium]